MLLGTNITKSPNHDSALVLRLRHDNPALDAAMRNMEAQLEAARPGLQRHDCPRTESQLVAGPGVGTHAAGSTVCVGGGKGCSGGEDGPFFVEMQDGRQQPPGQPQQVVEAGGSKTNSDHEGERTWKAAVVLGMVGGVVLGVVGGVPLGYLVIGDVWLGVLVGIAVGLCFWCGPCAYRFLSADHEIKNERARRVMEALVVAGWVAGAVLWLVEAVEEADGERNETVHFAVYMFFYILSSVLFVPYPVWFTLLAWNNVDTTVLRLLWAQLQYRVALAVTVWLVAVDAWWVVEVRGWNPLAAVCGSLVYSSPFFTVLCMDAMKRTSRAFRLGLPTAYVFFVLCLYAFHAYIEEPTAISRSTRNAAVEAAAAAAGNGTAFNVQHASVGMTFEGQAAMSLSVIISLMLPFLCRVYSDPSGNTVLFPVFIACLDKSAVPVCMLSDFSRRAVGRDGEIVLEKPSDARQTQPV
jgi:hypothetical protein